MADQVRDSIGEEGRFDVARPGWASVRDSTQQVVNDPGPARIEKT